MNKINIDGNFFEQFLTAEDKQKSEDHAIRILKRQQLDQENKDLRDKLKSEVSRIFETKHMESDFDVFLRGDRVTVAVSLSKIAESNEFGLKLISVRPYDSQLDHGKIVVSWPKKPALLTVSDGHLTHTSMACMSIQINDWDFQKRMQMVFRLAKATLKLKPMIRG